MSDIAEKVQPLVERLRRCGIGQPSGILTREAADEIERLTNCLKIANAQAERFEREWYLRGDAIERALEDSEGGEGGTVCGYLREAIKATPGNRS